MKTKEQVIKEGSRVLAVMKGVGWKLRIWQNLGWHWCVENEFVAIYPYDRQFFASLKPHYAHYGSSPSGKNPNKLADKAVAMFEEYAETEFTKAKKARESLCEQ